MTFLHVGEIRRGEEVRRVVMMCRVGYAYRDFRCFDGRNLDGPIENHDPEVNGWFADVELGGHARRPWNPGTSCTRVTLRDSSPGGLLEEK